MKRTIAAVACVLGGLFVGNAHHVSTRQSQKRVQKELCAADKETRFVRDLMQKMTLTEKIGQLSQYVGGSLLTGPQSGALSDSLFVRGMVGSILNVGGVENLRKLQEKNMQASRLKIPVLFAFDVIHGYKTIFPTPLAESCLRLPRLQLLRLLHRAFTGLLPQWSTLRVIRGGDALLKVRAKTPIWHVRSLKHACEDFNGTSGNLTLYMPVPSISWPMVPHNPGGIMLR